jgi:hypothetical protein
MTQIPPHTHKGPGLRYVLDGAISVVWKDRGGQTFNAGSTISRGQAKIERWAF